MSLPIPPPPHFLLLGEFQAHSDAGPVDIRPHKQRLLLATLVCGANRPVTVDHLIDAIWDATPPRTARKNVQAYVSILRKDLGDRIRHTGYGYVLHCRPDDVDVGRFELAVGRGRDAARAGDLPGAAAAYAEALAQWRGPFLADMPRTPALDAECTRLTERRLRTFEDWADVAARLGQHRDVLDTIDDLADKHPERERLTAAKLTALYRCGQRQEAIGYYEQIRSALADEFGLDPSPELQRMFRAILAGAPALANEAPPAAGPGPRAAAAGPGRAVASPSTAQIAVVRGRAPAATGAPAGGTAVTAPAGGTATAAALAPADRIAMGNPLPPDLRDFTGREREIGRLVAGFAADRGDSPTTVVTGPVGIGKTALAVHAAHLCADRFPDGRLLIEMRHRDRRPRPLPDLLRGLAHAFGVDIGDPAAPDASAEWRRWLSRHRVLVVLDDARDEPAVRALQPGAGPSRMVVTSRFQLSGLDPAPRLTVADLAGAEAVELAAKIAGLAAVLDRHDELAGALRTWGRSPLAVRIIAGRLRDRPSPRPGDLAQLTLGDLSMADRYAGHFQDLPADGARALAALASTGAPPYDGTSLAGVPGAVDSLVEANLLLAPDDEVVAHGLRYDMPPAAYVCLRDRLAPHTAAEPERNRHQAADA